MTDSELHDRLGELIGLAQAMRRITAAIVERQGPGLETDVSRLLDQLVQEIAEMQGRCDSIVATHTRLKLGRVTTRSREIRAEILRPALMASGTYEQLTILAALAQQALIRWRGLDASGSAEMATLITHAIRIHEDYGGRLAVHISSVGGAE